MTTTISVVPDHDVKDGYKVLVNYLQRGIVYHSPEIANQQALNISEKQPYDHLILHKKLVKIS